MRGVSSLSKARESIGEGPVSLYTVTQSGEGGALTPTRAPSPMDFLLCHINIVQPLETNLDIRELRLAALDRAINDLGGSVTASTEAILKRASEYMGFLETGSVSLNAATAPGAESGS